MNRNSSRRNRSKADTQSTPPWARKRKPVDGGVSASEIDRRAKAALRAANADELVMRNEWVGNRVVRRPGTITGIKNGTREEQQYEEWKRSIGSVAGERVKLKKYRDPARYFVKTHANMFSGVATFKRQCSTKGVKHARRKILRDVRQFFEEKERHHPILHFLSVVEETFRRAGGKVYHHVHVHFLVMALSGGYDPAQASWYPCFQQRFGRGSGIEPVRTSKQRLVSYLFKRQERKFLLDHGIFVEWFKQVKGTRRVVAYGPLRDQMAKHAAKGCRPVLGRREKKLRLQPINPRKSALAASPGKPGHMRGVTLPDTYLGKRRRMNPDGSWSYWDFFRNKQSAKDVLYRRLGIPEYGDEGTELSAYLYSNSHAIFPQNSSSPTSTAIHCSRTQVVLDASPAVKRETHRKGGAPKAGRGRNERARSGGGGCPVVRRCGETGQMGTPPPPRRGGRRERSERDTPC